MGGGKEETPHPLRPNRGEFPSFFFLKKNQIPALGRGEELISPLLRGGKGEKLSAVDPRHNGRGIKLARCRNTGEEKKNLPLK